MSLRRRGDAAEVFGGCREADLDRLCHSGKRSHESLSQEPFGRRYGLSDNGVVWGLLRVGIAGVCCGMRGCTAHEAELKSVVAGRSFFGSFLALRLFC
jgi:hypothetical protein